MGRDAVVDALKVATRRLLTEKGPRFSVREAADLAGVNQGLIYRHVGSKEELIAASIGDLLAELEGALAAGRSPIEIVADDHAQLVTVLARLVLDDAGSLVPQHPVTSALMDHVDSAGPTGEPSPATRVAIAASALLGWVLFRTYLVDAVDGEVSADADEIHRALIDDLLVGDWPVGR